MKKVLYISNIEVPYRVRFFNELAKYCDLTVLYERKRSSNRNAEWAKSETRRYRVNYMRGIHIGGENTLSLGAVSAAFSGYDSVIIGCYNSPAQMLAILTLRLFGKAFIVNLDGEPFLKGGGFKFRLKRFFLRGAKAYLTAGEKAAESLRECLGDVKAVPYYFSSLTEEELKQHHLESEACVRNDTILVVGQYFDYKGMDIALEAARLDESLKYRFVGMGVRTQQFLDDYAGAIPGNVEVIPFLQKAELEEEYKRCGMLVLPSRQECWGLVINEAASFGMPIVSTWGSGAAVEFLADRYPRYLAQPENGESLLKCIRTLQADSEKEKYMAFLTEKSKAYSIEKSVVAHLEI